MPRDPSRIPAIAARAPKAGNRKRKEGGPRTPVPLSDPAVRAAVGATTIEKIPDVYCPTCGEIVTLDTDLNGRLMAYDHRTWKPHRHPEAAKGESALPEPEVREPREVSDADIMAILEADVSAQKCADKYGQTLSWVYDVWAGSIYAQPGYDYEDGKIRRKQRSAARGRAGQKQAIGNRELSYRMQRLQV